MREINFGCCLSFTTEIHIFGLDWNILESKYGDGAKLLLTDTESLMFEVELEDFKNDMSMMLKISSTK